MEKLLQFGVIGLVVYIAQFIIGFLLNSVGLGLATASGLIFWIATFLGTGYVAVKSPDYVMKWIK